MAQLPALFSPGRGRPMPDSAESPFGTKISMQEQD